MSSSLRHHPRHLVAGFICHLLVLLPLTAPTLAQSQTSAVPRLIKFGGVVKDAKGNPRSGTVGVTFALYKEEQGGSALWLETQNVQADAQGHYSVFLGATKSTGLPQDVFVSGEARWLGVQPEGQGEQARTLLLSVPYALKAGDAETVGGLPASAFVLAAPGNAGSSGASSSAAGSGLPPALGGGGTVNFIPLWTPDGSTLGNSVLFQSGTGGSAKTGINTITPAATLDVNGGVIARGAVQLPSKGTATAGGGFASQPFSLQGSAFNSSSQQAIGPLFQWQTEPSANNSANPAGTLNLLYGNGSGSPGETGLNIASNGQIKFASGQTFPGAGTITGITAGTGLSGGGTSGNVTLSINVPFANQNYARLKAPNTFTADQTVTGNLSAARLISTAAQGTVPLQVSSNTQVPNLNASLLGGFNATQFQPAGSYATLGSNSFTGNQSITGNLTASGTVTAPNINATTNYQLGGNTFAFGSFSNGNVFLGFGGNAANTGVGDTAVGYQALASDLVQGGDTAIGYKALSADTAPYNTAVGYLALASNTSGAANTASGWNALFANTTGSNNSAYGPSALEQNTTGAGNSAIGLQALFSNTTGQDNNAIGESALHANAIGNNNTGDGSFVLYNTTGSGNTATGYSALQANTSGSNNTALGINAGNAATFAMTTGSNNTFIGANSGPGAQTGLSNATAIGANAIVTASNAIILGGIGGVNGGIVNTQVGIGTTAPTALLDVRGTANFTGPVTFASNQTFPGTISGVTAGFGLLGGGTLGNVLVTVDTTKVVTGVTAGTDLTGGGTGGVQTLNLDTSKVPLLQAANNFTGNQGVTGNLTVSGTASGTVVNAASSFNLAGSLFAFGSAGNGNAYIGFAGKSSTGNYNTAVGVTALPSIGDGCCNTAAGFEALFSDVDGGDNTAIGWAALSSNTTGIGNTALGWASLGANDVGSYNTAVGAGAGPGSAHFNHINTTALGAHAEVDVDNALVLGAINGVNGATADTLVGVGITTPVYKLHVGLFKNSFRVEGPSTSGSGGMAASFGGYGDFGIDGVGLPEGRFVVKESGRVGIGTGINPSNIFTIGQGKGQAISDGWVAYSSRRWKTNIHPLDNALGKVEHLRGVSYDLKGSGKHEIGVIAEEVGAVVPEVVSFEANGKDAQGVDYSRLTALLIEAVKQQQAEIANLRAQLKHRAAKDALMESRLAKLERDRNAAAASKLALYRSPTTQSSGASTHNER